MGCGMSMWKRIQVILTPLVLLLAVFAVTACGDDRAARESLPAGIEFTIEPGALARHMRGETTELIPSEIDLVAGQSIVIHNQDQALHYFLSTPVWPGQTLTKTFDEPGTYRYSGAFTCSIGVTTALTITVSDA